MITHLGISFKRHDGVLINNFQLIDKPFPNGKSYAELRYENRELVSQIYAESLTLEQCDKFALEASEKIEALLLTKKAFKVASVSSNTNSFGLYGHILVAKDGEAWEAARNEINRSRTGDIIWIPFNNGEPNFAVMSFEIPKRLPKAPDEVLKAVWKD